MLSLVEVKCPHCGAKGQIVMPPLGAIIIGPCPKCEELLIVFCGQVLPLDKEIVMHGSPRDKHEHLMGVLTDFLEERVADLVRQTTPDADDESDWSPSVDDPELGLDGSEHPATAEEDISQKEVEQFVNVDLNLIDNRDYFRAVFG
jgi:hypothetical protein